ncbi:MAG: hypothetical protein OK452_06265, partial [Thaumarchaeota archaeon]|nr:hypothetical protein [Nitrososphaerota archaeon]
SFASHLLYSTSSTMYADLVLTLPYPERNLSTALDGPTSSMNLATFYSALWSAVTFLWNG